MEVAVFVAAFALYQKVNHQLGGDGVDAVDPVAFLDVCFWSSRAVQRPVYLEAVPTLLLPFSFLSAKD